MKTSNPFLCRLALFLGLGGILLYLVKPFVIALAAGLVFGMALTPLFGKWRSKYKWVGPRFKATVLTLGFFCAFLVPMGATLYFGVTSALQQIKESKNDKLGTILLSGDTSAAIGQWMEQSPRARALIKKIPIPEEKLWQMNDQASAYLSEKFSSIGQEFIASLPATIFGLIVALATVFFILADGKKARPFVEYNPAFSPEATRQIIDTFRDSSYSVVVSAVIARAAQALILVLACVVAGKGSPLLIGLLTFFCSFLPLFGSFLVAGAMMIVQLMAGNVDAALIFLAFGLVAGVADNFLMSWLVGDQVKIPALLVFVTAFGGVEMIGLYGLFVGPVVAAVFLKVIEVLAHPSIPTSSGLSTASGIKPVGSVSIADKPSPQPLIAVTSK